MFNVYKSLTWSVVNLVNAPRGQTYYQQRDKLLLKGTQRQQFVAVAQQIVAGRLALGSLGELSLRLASNQLAITTQTGHLAHLAETDIVTCAIDSDKPKETAASHLAWHRLIYLETPAQAVLLGHPQYTLTLANAGLLPEQQVMPAMGEAIGGVSLLPAAEVSPVVLAAAVQGRHVALVPQIGALIWGDSLDDLLVRAEALEYLSQLTLIAGQVNLPPGSC